MQFILKYATTLLLSSLAREMAGEVTIRSLRRLAKSTKNTLDDELVEVLAGKLNIK